ncbi:xanthine dehydrogenase family protein molybdopterin-binding subunit [Paenibacillus sp. OV219]|uniref:xanthine dehydrogenase family protein molybdopterin-binding subunit n=1 Tax=Paenibacillus sp. OV219 TaxID=1884377 RepID=UPI0008BEF348|nr:xanthine dehydrogenase family protein molybdopterin-binding subunit [Paenibacillus sp. OV219]SEO30755.1 CO or xanthine dehydrogenase, Mo-binding subunit [Paenibacillus sp. OV219]
MEIIGKPIPRVESRDKVTGFARYTNDSESPSQLHGWLVTSPYAHARIVSIDTTEVLKVIGVQAVVIGADFPVLTGPFLVDRPPLAVDKVRYYGEPIAVVVAETERIAKLAAELILAAFEPLPIVLSPSEALQPDAPLLHADLGSYVKVGNVYPVPDTNIGNDVRIRKGDMEAGWAASEVVVEDTFCFDTSDHGAMEPRCAIVEVMPSGIVEIQSATQDPFNMRRAFQRFFQVEESKVIVRTPLVGGGFGGKGSFQLEYIAYMASKKCGGRPVKINNTRESDMISSPCHIGLEATLKLGATRDGKLMAAQYTMLFNTGGYSDTGSSVTQAGANDCTGPYRIDNVYCDALCVYTNHPYATAYRGFGHAEAAFCNERMMDLLARKLQMDPVQLRLINAIKAGDTSPTQALLTESNLGDLPACIAKMKELIRWSEGERLAVDAQTIRAKGVACIWKTSTSAIESGSGAIITFNHDGTMNLSVGTVEIGQGNRTAMAQILAERMNVPIQQVHIKLDIDTQSNPEHWKTVASVGTTMAGRAVLAAAEDAIAQLKHNASLVMKLPPEELEVGGGNVYVKGNPDRSIAVRDLAIGYTNPDGTAVGEPVIGRGTYRIPDTTKMDPETGKGKPGNVWTLGAQAVEVEFNPLDCTYRLLKAVSVFDAGRVINEGTARGQVYGGMNMGLSFATRETFQFDDAGRVLNPQLRSYKITRYGETPEYDAAFVETPFKEGPYGARGVGEHGVIGMPAALANALSVAAGVELNMLPLIPELIWRYRGGGEQT